MRHIKLLLFVLYFSGTALAQGPLDPDCYYPSFSDPSQIDSIYGSQSGQALGKNLVNLGPWVDESYGRIAFQGHPSNLLGWTAVQTGPTFDLHNLDVKGKMTFSPPGQIVRRGNFRNKGLDDLFVEVGRSQYRVYWQDEEGNYDANRFAKLGSPILDAYGAPLFDAFRASAVDLDGDKLLDIVVSVTHVWVDPLRDSLYLLFYRGGRPTAADTVLLPDSIRFWLNGSKYDLSSTLRTPSVGDFRGVGREDIVFSNTFGSLYYYRNDHDFTFDKYIQAVWYDTLLAAWQNPDLVFQDNDQCFIGLGPTMQILPRPAWDKSVDLSLIFPVYYADDIRLSFYRGGPDFGIKRIFLDTADDFIRHPAYYDASWNTVIWPGSLEDCGDMTGTGNKVIKIGASAGLDPTSMACFYVVGKALDSKIDMFLSDEYLVGYGDTITADDDGLQDYIAGHGIYSSWEDHLKGEGNRGMIYLIHGSKKIPVKLNPKYAVERKGDNLEISTFPNPATEVLSIKYTARGPSTSLSLFDPLGRLMLSRRYSTTPGEQVISLDLAEVSSGTYILSLISGEVRVNRTISVLR